jgi:hypothetical protein
MNGPNWNPWTSEPQMPTYSTSIRTSSSLGSGTADGKIFMVPGVVRIASEFFMVEQPPNGLV